MFVEGFIPIDDFLLDDFDGVVVIDVEVCGFVVDFVVDAESSPE